MKRDLFAHWARLTKGAPVEGLGESSIYACNGTFIRDDGSGTLTGSAGGNIARIPHQFRHFAQLVCGEASGNFTTGSSTFGSIDDADTDLNDFHTLLGDWDSFYPVLDQITIDDMATQFGRQAPIAFFKSIWDGKWKMPVYPSNSPGTHKKFLDPAGSVYKWKVGEDFIADSTEVSFTPVDECVNEVHVRFGFFAPTGSYKYDAWVGPSGSDDGTGTRDQNSAAPDNRETYAADSKADYRVKGVLNVDMPTCTSYLQAVKLRNYLFDRLYRPRVVVKFTTHARAIGLEPGHFTLIHNDLQDHIPCPWYPGPRHSAALEWDDLAFFVRDLSFDYSGGQVLHTVTNEQIPTGY